MSKWIKLIIISMISSLLLLSLGCCTSHHEGKSACSQKKKLPVVPPSDSFITSRVKAELITAKSVPSARILVKTDDRLVRLTGYVDNKKEAKAAVKAAQSVSGVRGVYDSLVIANQTPRS